MLSAHCPTIAACTFAILLGGIAAPNVYGHSPVQTESGVENFFGSMEAGPRQFRFYIVLNASSDNEQAGDKLKQANRTGKLVSLDEGKREFKLSSIEIDDKSFAFEIEISKAVYQGNFDKEKGKYVGSWKQSGGSFPLAFERVNEMPVEDYAAIWEGTINLVVQKLSLRIRETKSGEVFLDSVTQLAGGFHAKKDVQGNVITIEIPSLRASFKGTLSEEGDTITGKWKQGLISVALTLSKSKNTKESTASEEPDRPQTPTAPFPYVSEEVTFENSDANITLAGTLTLPNDVTNPPAVVLISGSGPQDRNEAIMNHKPFLVIADYLSRRGVAVLRFDDRGVGESEGDFKLATTMDFKTDVAAAVSFLKSDERINKAQIGLCGHSEGGLIAPLVASDDKEIAFIVLLAGPGVNGEKVLINQAQLILEASGIEGASLERQSKIQQVFLTLAKRSPMPTQEEFTSQALEGVAPLLTEPEKSSGADKEMVAAAEAQLLSPWFHFFLSHEPAPVLEQLACPVLVLNGEKDLQVDPELNLPAIRAALTKAPTDDFKLVELPSQNHLFQVCETGLITEYGELEETFNEGTLKLISDWILDKTK